MVQWNLFSNIKYAHPIFLFFHIRIANDNYKKNKKIWFWNFPEQISEIGIFDFFRIFRI